MGRYHYPPIGVLPAKSRRRETYSPGALPFLQVCSISSVMYHTVSRQPSRRWHRTRPWRSEYFDWHECKLMPRLSINPQGKPRPKSVGQLLALTKLRAFDRPAERRTWDQGKTHFVIQDPFDYHVVRPMGLSSTGALISIR